MAKQLQALALSILTLFPFQSFALGQESAVAETTATEADDVSLSLLITNEAGEPLEGANVQVLKWTGNYEDINVEAETDQSGKVDLRFPYTDNYFYVRLEAEGYAINLRDLLHISAGSQEQIEFKLSNPASPWVQVTAGGEPLAGAEISMLEFTDVNSNKVTLTHKIGQQLGYEMLASDKDGKLVLPSLPRNASVSLTVTHPQYRPAKRNEIKAIPGQVGTLDLQPGVQIEVQLRTQNPDDLKRLEDERAEVMMFTSTGGSRDLTTIRHTFPVKNGRVRFTASPVEYQSLRFTVDDFFTGPMLANYPDRPDPRFNLEGKQKVAFELDALPKRKARGRLVDNEGKGIANAYVSASIGLPKETTEDLKKAASDEQPSSLIGKYAQEWMSAGTTESDEEGNYEIEIAPGKVSFEVIHEGYFSTPVTTECVWSGDIKDHLPEKVMLPIPELRGQVVDVDGKPVIGSVVRVRHRGRGDADPLNVTSGDGSFELKLSRIPYSWSSLGLETTVYVLAFDPDSDRAGITEVDLTKVDSSTKIQVEIKPESADWPLNAIEPSQEQKRMQELWGGQIDELKELYADGISGKVPPEMSGGTWLNTNAQSLEDFRGKHVLLDFWFIGCGPCMRDMPSVKLAHQEFSKHGFSVISVNVLGQKVEDVEAFAREHGMNYPIVVDGPEGTILEAYKSCGVKGFPSYILLGPDGRIIHNDQVSNDFSLRQSKLEIIYKFIRESLNSNP
ncbi:MAG: redoxin family protein [Planctomycetota bacterium]